MTKLERIQAALKRRPTDRPPYAFWRHFPDVDRSPAALAQSTLRFHERYGSDFLKVTPTGGYAVEDWGCVEGNEVMPDGHRPCTSHAVNSPEDWKKIRPVAMESTAWAGHIEALIRAKGYKMPAGMMYIRLVHLLDEQKRKELMIIYGEDLADTGYTAVELHEGGKAYDRWPAIEEDLVARAEKKIMIEESAHP